MNLLLFILLFYILPGLFLWIIFVIIFKSYLGYNEQTAEEIIVAIFVPCVNIAALMGMIVCLFALILNYFCKKIVSKKKFNTKKFFLVK